ncbi:flavodoxin domain-containing protein [Candidatus Dojkabacteria bacterium]|uniref:Flavodoxin domain-containing protein n=1 Tax=Candidatus Dojkabacteria bacterium TaxID=2099670 RepID=A0A955L8Y7_9BACT|nr:flavodoxin domain-containing protein [Candidatus Dojkabacteria bacterium]
MRKVFLVYGSTTGLTEICAEHVKDGLIESGVDVIMQNVLDTTADELDDYEYIVLGCSTWDYGCLQYDFEPFHEDMKLKDLTGKKFAVFGTGDKAYGETYCEALRTLTNTVEACGGTCSIEAKDIESDLREEQLQATKDWAKKFGLQVSGN